METSCVPTKSPFHPLNSNGVVYCQNLNNNGEEVKMSKETEEHASETILRMKGKVLKLEQDILYWQEKVFLCLINPYL